MFKEDNIYENKINGNLEGEIPRDPFEGEDLVVYNHFKRFGDENDQLMMINFRRYGFSKIAEPEKKWHYTGDLFKMKKVNSVGVPIVPYETQIIYEVPEDSLINRRELLSY